MIKHYQVLLLAVPVLICNAYAAPLEFVTLSPKAETAEVLGEVLQGDTRSFRVTTERKTIRFFIEATSNVCSLEVRKVSETVVSRRFDQFPYDSAEITKSGDQFTFIFAQSRDAWLKKIPCRFAIKVNG